MMELIEIFKFSKDVTFELMVPPLGEKYNYYYKSTKVLHKFDEVSVVLDIKGVKTTIVNDILQDVICSLSFHLKKALQNELILPSQIPLGSLMNFYNRDHYRHYWQDENLPYIFTIDCDLCWLWSTPDDMQSWIYNRDNKIYLEIEKVYAVPEPQNDQAFEEYITQNKPFFFEEISREIAQDWLKKAERIVYQIGSNYKD